MFNTSVFIRPFSILLMSFISYSFTYAQENKPIVLIGIHTGPTFCTYYTSYNTMYNSLKDDYNPGIGYIGGISMQTNFSHRWTFRFETNYEQFEYSYSEIPRPGYFTTFSIRSVKTGSISLPLSFNYHFLNHGKTNLFLNFGNYWNYLFSEHVHDEFSSGRKEIYARTGNKRLRMGLLAGLGINRTITDHLRLTLEIRDLSY